MFLTNRGPWLLGFLAASFAMLFALYLQYFQDLHPCAMCVFQRVAMIATGLAFLVAALIGPKGRGRIVAGIAAFIPAIAGAAVAARHVWLQNLPEDQVPACGAGLEAMLDVFPLAEVIKLVLSGDGNCAVIDWTLLGLSLPAWTMIGFAALALWALVSVRVSRQAIS